MGRAEEIFQKLQREGVAAINEMIFIRQSEELFLDFKCSADNGKGKKLHDRDLRNLARAISGFGNSEGGVIIWGVDASKDIDDADVAKARQPIHDVSRFVSWLEGTVSGRTVPAHSGVQNHQIDLESGNGFVATLIPKSERAPHQAIPEQKYYIRAGSSFLPVPHSVLAGMFGRRLQSDLFQEYVCNSVEVIKRTGGPEIDVTLGFKICNRGPAIARDLYSDIQVALPGPGTVHFTNMDKDWSSKRISGGWLSMTSKDDFKLAPESLTTAFNLRTVLKPPFENGRLWFKWTFGCDGSPMKVIEFENTAAAVERIYHVFLAARQTEEDKKKLVYDLFSLQSVALNFEGQRRPSPSQSGSATRRIRGVTRLPK